MIAIGSGRGRGFVEKGCQAMTMKSWKILSQKVKVVEPRVSEWIKQVNKTTFSLFSKILTFINNKCNHRAERLTTAWILS